MVGLNPKHHVLSVFLLKAKEYFFLISIITQCYVYLNHEIYTALVIHFDFSKDG